MSAPVFLRQPHLASEFQHRHIGPSPHETAQMLSAIGAESLEQLMAQTLPASIRQSAMKSLEDRWPVSKFKRVHRSFIVNIKKITGILGNMVELMEAGKIKQLPIGKNYRDELLDLINENKL